MVLITKKDKRAVLQYLLNEGVIVVKKDCHLAEHQYLKEVPNLNVMLIMKSLRSKKYVEETFSWQWSYYVVTNEGVKYLRERLGIIYIYIYIYIYNRCC